MFQHSPASGYVELIKSFVTGKIDAEAFEAMYLTKFKNDPTEWSEAAYEVLNDLFGDVDAFCSNPDLRGPADLDEDQLRHRSEIALQKLQSLGVP